MINHYDAYKHGILPNTGALDDQPTLYLQIMTVIGNAFAEEEKFEHQERAKKKELEERVNARISQQKGKKVARTR